MTSEQKLEGDERGLHADSERGFRGKGISVKGNSKCKGPGVGTGLECCITRQLVNQCAQSRDVRVGGLED